MPEAIPGIAAKPIIDILVGVADWQRFGDLRRELERLAYVYTPESERDDPTRRVFRKGSTDFALPRTHHVHMTVVDGDYWVRMLAFRDHLRDSVADAALYEALKRQLALEHATNPRKYSQSKAAFVRSIEQKAVRHTRE